MEGHLRSINMSESTFSPLSFIPSGSYLCKIMQIYFCAHTQVSFISSEKGKLFNFHWKYLIKSNQNFEGDIESWGLAFTMWRDRVDSAYSRPGPLTSSHMQRNIKEVTVGILFITARLFYAIIMCLPGSKSLPHPQLRTAKYLQLLKCSPGLVCAAASGLEQGQITTRDFLETINQLRWKNINMR